MVLAVDALKRITKAEVNITNKLTEHANEFENHDVVLNAHEAGLDNMRLDLEIRSLYSYHCTRYGN
jgi:hypothetical protein